MSTTSYIKPKLLHGNFYIGNQIIGLIYQNDFLLSFGWAKKYSHN